MTEWLGAGLLLVILLGSAAFGLFARPFLSEAHRSRETTDFVQLVVTMLVTFVAVVLGLLTSSAKASFDQVGNELKGLSVALIQLDRSLRQWGGEAETARQLLREYTAAVIAGTWRQDKPPAPAMVPRSQTPARSEARHSETCFRVSSSTYGVWSHRIRCSAGSRLPASPSLSG